MIDLNKEVSENLITYTTFDTMCDVNNLGLVRPTSEGQIVLLKKLQKDLEDLGIPTYFGKESVVMGVLKGNKAGVETIGFMAHVDTSDNVNGNNVKAQRVLYKGGDILLKDGVVIDRANNPDLDIYIGEELITSDGTSLLGGDDKAGIAEIMAAIEYLVKHPEIEHGDIEIYFTPDEETGSGMDQFPYERLKSICCYTMDGGREGEVEVECFNAATMKVKIDGVGTHLGYARGQMVNAITVASQIVCALPQAQSPEATDKRYGYYSVLDFNATCTEASMNVFIRDFDKANFEKRIEFVNTVVKTMSDLYGAKSSVETQVSYYNMAQANEKLPEALSSILDAAASIELPVYQAIIRGGTDGARLAQMGTPCPNIFTGGHNFHSLNEWISVSAMNKASNLILAIVQYWCNR